MYHLRYYYVTNLKCQSFLIIEKSSTIHQVYYFCRNIDNDTSALKNKICPPSTIYNCIHHYGFSLLLNQLKIEKIQSKYANRKPTHNSARAQSINTEFININPGEFIDHLVKEKNKAKLQPINHMDIQQIKTKNLLKAQERMSISQRNYLDSDNFMKSNIIESQQLDQQSCTRQFERECQTLIISSLNPSQNQNSLQEISTMSTEKTLSKIPSICILSNNHNTSCQQSNQKQIKCEVKDFLKSQAMTYHKKIIREKQKTFYFEKRNAKGVHPHQINQKQLDNSFYRNITINSNFEQNSKNLQTQAELQNHQGKSHLMKTKRTRYIKLFTKNRGSLLNCKPVHAKIEALPSNDDDSVTFDQFGIEDYLSRLNQHRYLSKLS